jgi:hypothetical protein
MTVQINKSVHSTAFIDGLDVKQKTVLFHFFFLNEYHFYVDTKENYKWSLLFIRADLRVIRVMVSLHWIPIPPPW